MFLSFSIPFLSLFTALFFLALAPNLSVLIVTTRAATAGFRQGAYATLGIVAATLVYIVLSAFGLMIVAEMRPEARHALRLIAAVYLVWRGIGMVRNAEAAPKAMLPVTTRSAASFAMGFLLTLLSLKTLVFYVSFLPAFTDIEALDLRSTLGLLGIVALATGAAKLAYVALSARGSIVPSVRVGKALNVIAGCIVAAVGVYLAAAFFSTPAT
jgi:threonine/homoserine/homoserine lactone efflux protein